MHFFTNNSFVVSKWLICISVFIYLFIYSFIYSFIYLFTYIFVKSKLRSLVTHTNRQLLFGFLRWLVHLPSCSPMYIIKSINVNKGYIGADLLQKIVKIRTISHTSCGNMLNRRWEILQAFRTNCFYMGTQNLTQKNAEAWNGNLYQNTR